MVRLGGGKITPSGNANGQTLCASRVSQLQIPRHHLIITHDSFLKNVTR